MKCITARSIEGPPVHHSPLCQGNPDASLYLHAHDADHASGACAGRVCGGPNGYADSACQPHAEGVDVCARSNRQRSSAGPDHSGHTPPPEHGSRHTRTYEQAHRVQHPTWASLPVNRDVLDDHRPQVPQSRRTRVKHSEGCSGRIELPGKGRRCARLLLGMGAITAHWPAPHQRRHNSKLKRRDHGRGPRASSMIGFLVVNRQVGRKRRSPSKKSGTWPSFTRSHIDADTDGLLLPSQR